MWVGNNPLSSAMDSVTTRCNWLSPWYRRVLIVSPPKINPFSIAYKTPSNNSSSDTDTVKKLYCPTREHIKVPVRLSVYLISIHGDPYHSIIQVQFSFLFDSFNSANSLMRCMVWPHNPRPASSIMDPYWKVGGYTSKWTKDTIWII